MKNTDDFIHEKYPALASCYLGETHYPAEDIPYSCSEEADAANAESEPLLIISETNYFNPFERMLKCSIDQHEKYIETGDSYPQSALEMISSELERHAKSYYYQLIDSGISPMPRVRIELVDSPLWNEHSLPIFVSKLASLIEKDWDVTIIWLPSYSQPKAFKVTPSHTEGIG